MLEEILRSIKNYFVKEVYKGEYSIADGNVVGVSDILLDGQYFKIKGSVLNDGVYKYPATTLVDESFKGEIWALAIPKDFLDLVNDIDEWRAKYEADSQSPYRSESFGGYSYSKSSSYNSSSSSGSVGWEDIFKRRLNRWRKI